LKVEKKDRQEWEKTMTALVTSGEVERDERDERGG